MSHLAALAAPDANMPTAAAARIDSLGENVIADLLLVGTWHRRPASSVAPSSGRIITRARVNACMLASTAINCQRIVNVLELWMTARKRSRKADEAGASRDSEGQVGAMPSPAGQLRILSSAHLAEGEWGELSEFEFGLIVSYNAFSRWAVRCMAAAGMPDLTITDVLVLHHVHHRGRSKKLADVCFTLSYEDTHVVNYSLKKLLGLGLLSSEKVGKEVHYATTATAAGLLRRYREVREQCLL